MSSRVSYKPAAKGGSSRSSKAKGGSIFNSPAAVALAIPLTVLYTRITNSAAAADAKAKKTCQPSKESIAREAAAVKALANVQAAKVQPAAVVAAFAAVDVRREADAGAAQRLITSHVLDRLHDCMVKGSVDAQVQKAGLAVMFRLLADARVVPDRYAEAVVKSASSAMSHHFHDEDVQALGAQTVAALCAVSKEGADMCVRLGIHATLARNAALGQFDKPKERSNATDDCAAATSARDALAALVAALKGRKMSLKAVSFACKSSAQMACSKQGERALKASARKCAGGLLSLL